jgi:hypothetical protein
MSDLATEEDYGIAASVVPALFSDELALAEDLIALAIGALTARVWAPRPALSARASVVAFAVRPFR